MTSAVSLRPLEDADLAAVLALNNDNVPAVSEVDAAALAHLVAVSTVAVVAEVDDGVAGFCLVMPPGVDYASVNYRWFSEHAGELGDGRFAYLDRVAVAEAARRHGVGRVIYAHVIDAVRPAATVLCLEVNVVPRNDASLAFHERLGFREVGQQDTDGGKRVSLLALDL